MIIWSLPTFPVTKFFKKRPLGDERQRDGIWYSNGFWSDGSGTAMASGPRWGTRDGGGASSDDDDFTTEGVDRAIDLDRSGDSGTHDAAGRSGQMWDGSVPWWRMATGMG